ncbi:protein of unknown function [Desulfuromusa kysingii]|uniref:LysM domain-containing protein n=1 Tax=Desulfuromusa kysingii TaxID=37625 RepID=A0A1H4EAM4_9BACT|nr:DUF4398 domain-containing protein [Desulfuromusa kysingii]SEA81877.1 protein of unknown function [Desulfuromusa kysingii]
MQMFYRLLVFVALMYAVSGCVKPPTESLVSAREVVAQAYAVGASQYAPGEYQLASSALQAAELQVKDGEHRVAARTLDLAQRFAKEALNLTIARKQQLLAEQKKKEEEKRRLELLKQREIERQAELKQQQEQKRKQQILKANSKKTEPVVPPRTPAVIEPVLVDIVEVQAGENLATIAARANVYGDALLWPLIYKANRDQIKDPQEIYQGQSLVIPRDKTRDEADAARQEARELNLFLPLTEK